MKTYRVVLWMVTLSLVPALSEGQNPKPGPTTATNQAAAESAKVDPAKAADIRKLLDLVGTKNLLAQSFGGSMEQIKPLVTRSLPPGAYREKLVDLFFAKFKSKIDLDQFVDMAVPTYDKYFTHDEIKGMIAFYQTPIGRKAMSVLPQITNELREMGSKWGQELGRNSMAEVLAEHPDLAAEMEAAGKANAPH